MSKGHFGAFLLGDEQVGGCLAWGDSADRSTVVTQEWFLLGVSEPPPKLTAVLYEILRGETVEVRRMGCGLRMPPKWAAGRWQRSPLNLKKEGV